MKFFTWRGVGHLLLGLVLLLLLWWLGRTITLSDLLHTLQQLTLGNLVGLGLANLLVLIVLCSRWWLLLGSAGYPIPFGRLLGYRVAAFAVSYFTPGPHVGGEPLQVYLVSQRHGVPPAVAIATVTLDKGMEMVSNFLVLAGGLALLSQQPHLAPLLSPRTLTLALGLSLLPLVLLGTLYAGRHGLARWVRQPPGKPSITSRLATWLQIIEQSETQIIALWRSHPRRLLMAGFVSVLSWGALIGEFWYMTAALGLGLSLSGAVTLLLAMRVAILLPLPAGLGALEASLTIAATALGLPPAAGLGLSLLIRLRDVSLGLIGLWLGGSALWQPRGGLTPPVTARPTATSFQASPLHERWPSEEVVG